VEVSSIWRISYSLLSAYPIDQRDTTSFWGLTFLVEMYIQELDK
jgi:hypothetical protein